MKQLIIFLGYTCLFFSIVAGQKPPAGATNAQKLEYMKTHGMADKIPAKQTDDIYAYANKEKYVPYSIKFNLQYSIKSTSDETHYYMSDGGEQGPGVKLMAHNSSNFFYEQTIDATCKNFFALIKNTGDDIHYNFELNSEEKGNFKNAPFVINGSIIKTGNSLNEWQEVTANGINTLRNDASENQIAEFISIGMPQTPLQGGLSNKNKLDTQMVTGLPMLKGRMYTDNAIIEKTATGFSIKKSSTESLNSGNTKGDIIWQLQVIFTEISTKK